MEPIRGTVLEVVERLWTADCRNRSDEELREFAASADPLLQKLARNELEIRARRN